MRQVLASLLVLLLAGCSGSPAEPDAGPRVVGEEGDAPRESTPGSGSDRTDNTTRIWEHRIAYTLDAAPAATTMLVPANVTDLHVRVSTTPTAPCGVNVGDAEDPLRPFAEFTAPSGRAIVVDLFANRCNVAGATVYSGSSGTALDMEEGTWQVAFHGRGHGLQQTLFVEGERVA